MSVVFYRIDDRLIHGQVMTGWSKKYNANRVIVVDNETAGNEFLCQVMRMSVPNGMDVKVCKEEEGLEAILNDDPDKKTIVLTKTPGVMLDLLNGGAEMKEMCVGGMGYLPGRKAVLRNIQINAEEYEQIKEVAAKGVDVFFQIVPDGKKLELSKVKLKF